MGDEMHLANMTPRGRLVAEVFDCGGEEFPSDYLETSGHLDPGVAVRLHDTCAALYDGRLGVQEAYDAWEDWESVLKGFAEGYGLDSLHELLAIADPLTPEERQPAMQQGLTGVVTGGAVSVTSERGTRSTLSAASWRSWEFICT